MAGSEDRHSAPREGEPVAEDPAEIARIEAENALRQFDRLRQMIAEATATAGFRLRSWMVLELNRLAVERLQKQAGTFRTVEIAITGTKHEPPPWRDVPRLVDELCDYVNESGKPAEHLAAYIMWRLNWIHPFNDGNGRTTRAVSYLILCARLGYAIPGTKTIPDLIAGNKSPYYRALDAADKAWADRGMIDVGEMERILHGALASQLASVLHDARGTP